jgi:hypothetical protein
MGEVEICVMRGAPQPSTPVPSISLVGFALLASLVLGTVTWTLRRR